MAHGYRGGFRPTLHGAASGGTPGGSNGRENMSITKKLLVCSMALLYIMPKHDVISNFHVRKFTAMMDTY